MPSRALGSELFISFGIYQPRMCDWRALVGAPEAQFSNWPQQHKQNVTKTKCMREEDFSMSYSECEGVKTLFALTQFTTIIRLRTPALLKTLAR